MWISTALVGCQGSWFKFFRLLFSGQFDTMSPWNDPVQDCIGQGWFLEVFIPLGQG